VTRSFRHWIARTLVGVMLFAQLAVAAYACPGLMSGIESVQPGPVPTATNCDQMPSPMDEASPNLCAQHCQYGQQSDQTQTVTVPAVLLTSLYIVAPVSQALQIPRMPVGLFAAVSPPHAILHCCFRD